MEQNEFLEKNVFKGLVKLKETPNNDMAPFFAEADFEVVLDKAEYYGIALYTIEAWHKGELYETINHESMKKKATDPMWYKKTFKTLRHSQEGLAYSATYKVSTKLLARKD